MEKPPPGRSHSRHLGGKLKLVMGCWGATPPQLSLPGLPEPAGKASLQCLLFPTKHHYKSGSKRPLFEPGLGQASLSGREPGQLKFMSEPRQFSDRPPVYDIPSPSLLATTPQPHPPGKSQAWVKRKHRPAQAEPSRQQAAGSRRAEV